MKKIFKIICLFCLFVVVDVKASNIVTYEKLDNIYYEVKIGEYVHQDIEPIIKINGKVVYCIEPEKLVKENLEYNVGDINSINLTKEELKKIELIGYYGYGFIEHDDYRYYLATQELIWRITRPNIIIDWINKQTNSVIDVKSFKEEIIYLVNNHNKIPKIDDIKTTINKEINLNYEGLKTFKLSNFNNHEITQNDDDLLIKTSDYVGKTKVTLEKIKRLDKDETTLYTLDGYQSLIYLNNTDEIKVSFSIVTEVGEITIQKIDKDTLKDEATIGTSFDNTIFNIYDSNNKFLQKVATDKTGRVTISNLKLNTYYIKEIKSGQGYKVNDKTYSVTLTNDKKNILLEIPNEVIKGKLEIIKTYANHILEENASFIISDEFNKEYTITTNNLGYASIILPYGKYEIKQIKGKKNYTFIKPQKFEITSDKVITYNFNDEIIKTKLIIQKKDKVTNELIKDEALFKIFDINNNTYLYQNNIDIFKTKDGIIEIDNIPLGKYEIIEIMPPIGYLKKENTVLDLTLEDIVDNKIEIPIYNEFILGKLEITKKGDNCLLDNVIFEIYAYNDIILNDTMYYQKNELVDTITTKDGLALSKYLPTGKYYVKEISTIYGYEVSDKINYFEINKDEIIKLELVNDLIRKKVIVNKFNQDNILLDNVKIGIFAKEDIIINNKVYYKKDELIKEDMTKNGLVIFDDLVVGKYYIKELEALEGYKIDNNDYDIEIINEDVKLDLINYKEDLIIYRIPNTGIESKKVDIFKVIILFIGYIVVRYIKD